LTTANLARFVFRYVQVTTSPAARATLTDADDVLGAGTVLVPDAERQATRVKSQPAIGSVSVSEYCPGTTVNDRLAGKAVSATSVSRENADSPPPVVVKAKSCGSLAGRVSFVTVIVPRLVFVKVQITASPASMANDASRFVGSPLDGRAERLSSQVTPVTSHRATVASVKT
jgi:hypothetical protein